MTNSTRSPVPSSSTWNIATGKSSAGQCPKASRLWLIGVSAKRLRAGLGGAPAEIAWGEGVRASNSHLPCFGVDAGVDPGIGEIGNQGDHEAEQREDIER